MGGDENVGVTTGQPNLYKQDLSKLDVSKLTALSREVISRQATINIGTIGHVAHGKSTIVKAISGVQTVRFKNELERNITIKLDNGGAENVGVENAPEQRNGRTDNALQLKETPKWAWSDLKDSKANGDDSSDEPPAKMPRLEKNERRYHLKEAVIRLEDIAQKPPKQRSGAPTAVSTNIYEVEAIVDKKLSNDVVLYWVKWKNWDNKFNTWEPISNLSNCLLLVADFEERRVELMNTFQNKYNYHPSRQDLEKVMRSLIAKKMLFRYTLPSQDRLQENLRRLSTERMRHTANMVARVKNDVLMLRYQEARENQLSMLKEWENEIRVITKNRPKVQVENNVDLEGPPPNFSYVNDYLPSKGVTIPEDPPVGCECVSCEFKSNCCGVQSGASFAYTTRKKIRVPLGTPVYECNKRCLCGTSCLNRVVQQGSSVQLCIFRTSTGCGWGVKSLQSIRKGSFVTEYVGEVVTNDEAEKRGKEYDAAGRTYLFDLDYNETEQCPYTVDAAKYGNISHFINHSCDPNLGVYGVWINCLDPNLPKLALFAIKDIARNEEITFDYMCQSLRVSINRTPQKNDPSMTPPPVSPRQRLELPHQIANQFSSNNIFEKLRPQCKCGAKKCRKYLF